MRWHKVKALLSRYYCQTQVPGCRIDAPPDFSLHLPQPQQESESFSPSPVHTNMTDGDA